MKYLFLATLLLSLNLISQSAEARAYIRIDHDKNDCLDGWMSMDVAVNVNNERFTFNPSCNFSFSQSFTTQNNLRCRIEAGMCSGFSPRQKIEVSCDDWSSESVNIDCPAN